MAGVAEHSSYREDPLGRLRRTAAFVAATTFGTVAEAEAAIAQVQRVHRRVKGTAPDGRAYSADDPDLVTFIHVAEVSSFLASSRRYGPRPLTPEQCDRYFEEVAPVALALGATLGATLGPPKWRATCCGCGPSSTPVPRPRRRGTGSCAAWPGGPASVPCTPSCWRPPSASCRAGPAGELGLSLAGPLDLLVDTAAVTPLTRG